MAIVNPMDINDSFLQSSSSKFQVGIVFQLLDKKYEHKKKGNFYNRISTMKMSKSWIVKTQTPL